MKKLLFSILALYFSTVCVFAQGGEKRRSVVIEDKTTIINEEEKKEWNCPKKNSFGLDLGFGAMSDENLMENEKVFNFAFGMRYLHNFCPYVGADFFKFNVLNFSAKTFDVDGYELFYFNYNPQAMTGFRLYTPSFGRCMSGFVAYRFGVGASLEEMTIDGDSDFGIGGGLCYEFEVGINLTRTFFLAYSYNHQGGTVNYDALGKYDINAGTNAFRIGFNFGR